MYQYTSIDIDARGLFQFLGIIDAVTVKDVVVNFLQTFNSLISQYRNNLPVKSSLSSIVQNYFIRKIESTFSKIFKLSFIH